MVIRTQLPFCIMTGHQDSPAVAAYHSRRTVFPCTTSHTLQLYKWETEAAKLKSTLYVKKMTVAVSVLSAENTVVVDLFITIVQIKDDS